MWGCYRASEWERKYGDSAFKRLEFRVDEDLEDLVVLHLDVVDQVHVGARYYLCLSSLHLNKLYNETQQNNTLKKTAIHPP